MKVSLPFLSGNLFQETGTTVKFTIAAEQYRTYDIIVTAKPSEGVTVTGCVTYAHGEEVSLVGGRGEVPTKM